MIAIQVILVLGFVFVLLRLLTGRGTYQTRAWTKIFGILFTLLAIVAIIFPESSNKVANAVGVGRGADLLLYMLTLAFVFVVLSLYIKGKKENQRFVQLARRMAILDAKLREKESK